MDRQLHRSAPTDAFGAVQEDIANIQERPGLECIQIRALHRSYPSVRKFDPE